MSSIKAVFSTVIASILVFPFNISAHHSVNAFFDLSDPITVEGTLTSVWWANPHVHLQMERITPDGATEVWEIESGGPTLLRRVGVTTDVVKVGERVTISGFPSTRNDNEMIGVIMELADGREMTMFATLASRFGQQVRSGVHITEDAAAVGEENASGIFRVWSFGRGPNQTNPEPAFTAAALAGRATYNPLTDDLALQCIPQGMPNVMDNPFPIEFVEGDGTIILRLEIWDIARTIHMNAAASDRARAATPLGYSTGHWEDNVLVVETTDIDFRYFDDYGTPQSAAMEVVERFALNNDESRLDYEVVMTDPETLLEPAVRYAHWAWVPGEELQAYDCTLEEED